MNREGYNREGKRSEKFLHVFVVRSGLCDLSVSAVNPGFNRKDRERKSNQSEGRGFRES